MQALHVVDYRDGDQVLCEANLGDKFYIVKSGTVDILKNGQKVRTIAKNDYFGERSIIFNDCRTATVVASGDC